MECDIITLAYESGRKARDIGLPCHVPVEFKEPAAWKEWCFGWHYRPVTMRDGYAVLG
jgi:hypothetical protein